MSAAVQLFRSCTTSLASSSRARAVANTSARSPNRRMLLAMQQHARHYSASSEADAESSDAGATAGADKMAEKAEGIEEDLNANALAEKLKAKEAEVFDLTSRLRYLQADFLNLQRNAAREKEQQRDFAITRFASDLLETVDVLSLALKSVPPEALAPPPSDTSDPPPEQSESPPQKSAREYLTELHTGVDMTQRLLTQTLFKYHVKPFDPTGDEFDPNRHEALYQAPIPSAKPGTIIDTQKIGYTIKDRVLRAAQVGVAQEPS